MKRRVFAVAALVPLGLLTGCTTAVASATPLTGSTTAVGSAIAGCKAVASDFNGDGYADVATSEPEDPITGGGVQIDYGSATGIMASKSHFLSQATPGVPGETAAEGVFGRTLVTGYFNDDCYADLAIGDPGDPGTGNVSEDGRGSVTVLYGSKNGLTTNNAHRFLGQATTDTSTNTGFGGSLASGDFNHDGRDDLAVGGEHNGLGAVAVLYGGAITLGAPSTWLSVSGGADALAAGDFNGDGYADLAAGTVNSTVNGKVSAGSVTVFNGSAKGITTTGSRRLTQETAGIPPGTSQAHAFFGVSLAAGDVNGDGLADLVVGISGQTLGTIKFAGDIAYIPGTPNGLTGSGAMLFSQATAGVPGDPQFLDSAGDAVAVGDLNGDGYADIAFSIPHDEVLGDPAVGSVIVLRGTKPGPTATGAVQLSEKTAGIPGGAPAQAQFGDGLHIAYIHGGKQDDLVVGAYMQSVGHAQGYAVVIPGIAGTGPTGTGAKEIGFAADGPKAVFITYFGRAFG